MLARGLGNASVLNTRGTSTLASAAEQAQMKMLLETIIQFDAPFGGGFDQVNPAARRFRFELQSSIGRALIQTEAAVNALVELGKIKSRYPRTAGVGYFAVRRFQWRPFIVSCLEFRVSSWQTNTPHETREPRLETRNPERGLVRSTAPPEFARAVGVLRRSLPGLGIILRD